MGGRGSGRTKGYAGKSSTEDSQPLDIRRLQRAGVLTPGRTTNWQWTVNGRVYASITIRAEVGNISLAYSYTAHGGACRVDPSDRVAGDDRMHPGRATPVVRLPSLRPARGRALRGGEAVRLPALQGFGLCQSESIIVRPRS